MIKSILNLTKSFARKVKQSPLQISNSQPKQNQSNQDQDLYDSDFIPLQSPTDLNSLDLFKDTDTQQQNQTQNATQPILTQKPDISIQPASKTTEKQIKLIQETLLYQGDDPYSDKIVQRPSKGFVWGLGGELMKIKEKLFTKGQRPTNEEIQAFLEFEQCKDIVCVDLEEIGRIDISKYAIIASTFSCRHTYRVALSLRNAFIDAEIPNLPVPPRIYGRKDDEWVMVSYQDMQVHLFVESAREEVDLEWKWRNPPSEEAYEEYERMTNSKSKKQIREPLRKSSKNKN